MKRSPFLVAVIAILLPSINACTDPCAGVACAPVPPMLTVAVYDTEVIDSVAHDVRTTEAVVLFRGYRTAGGVDIDTLVRSDSTYRRTTVPDVGYSSITIEAQRGERVDSIAGQMIRKIEGCCGYSVIGAYTLHLHAR